VEVPKVHLGCGPLALDGWVNLDIRPYPGANVVADVRDGLPFARARLVFAEHFVEHLTLRDAMRLLGDCRRLLDGGGVLRISTPNLDWVWATSYSSRWRQLSGEVAQIEPMSWRHDERSASDCLEINRAFHGWGHQFLYNRALLGGVLGLSGFDRIEWRSYGASDHPELRGLERHERHPEIAGVPDVLIVEASPGSAAPLANAVAQRLADYERDLNAS
jgi:predicted SAM-dependent methyltransferase